MSSILVELFLNVIPCSVKISFRSSFDKFSGAPFLLLVFLVLWPFFVSAIFPLLFFQVWGASVSIWKDRYISRKLDLKMAELPPIIRNSERIPTFSSLLECVKYFSDNHFKRAFVMALDYTAH